MPVTSIGDLARSYVLRTRNTDLRQSLTRLGQEVASGRTSDPVARLGGHFSYLSQIEHDLVLASSYSTGAKEVQISATTMQTALARIGEVTDGLVGTLTLATSASGPTDLTVAAGDYVVFSVRSSSTQNGGISSVDYVYSRAELKLDLGDTLGIEKSTLVAT